MESTPIPDDSQSWVFQCWAAFVLAVGAMIYGIWRLPTDDWSRGFLIVGYLFSVSACFTLAKTLRDRHESKRFVHRITKAQAEQFLKEHERM